MSRENKYDDPVFFEKYSAFPRSVQGLEAAGEWHELRHMLPDLAGKCVLDLGCGFGWHCIYAAEQGAAHVTGVDISENMLAQARVKSADYDNITYVHSPIEDFTCPGESFDLVISSLAFHYIACFDHICKLVHTCLVPGGEFVFSVEHPVFTAQGRQEWVCDSDGATLYWPVSDYFFEGEREAVFLGERVKKYHRTLATYLSGLLEYGFEITGLCEPTPPQEMLDSNPEMRYELLRPMILLISAKKPV